MPWENPFLPTPANIGRLLPPWLNPAGGHFLETNPTGQTPLGGTGAGSYLQPRSSGQNEQAMTNTQRFGPGMSIGPPAPPTFQGIVPPANRPPAVPQTAPPAVPVPAYPAANAFPMVQNQAGGYQPVQPQPQPVQAGLAAMVGMGFSPFSATSFLGAEGQQPNARPAATAPAPSAAVQQAPPWATSGSPAPSMPQPTFGDTFAQVYGVAPNAVRPMAAAGDYRTGGELAASGFWGARADAVNAIHGQEVIGPEMIQAQQGAYSPDNISNFLGFGMGQGRLGLDAARAFGANGTPGSIANDALHAQTEFGQYQNAAAALLSQLSPNGRMWRLLEQHMGGPNPNPAALTAMLDDMQRSNPQLFQEDPESQAVRGFLQQQQNRLGPPVGQFNGNYLTGTTPAAAPLPNQFLGGGQPRPAVPQGWHVEPSTVQNPQTRVNEPNLLAGMTAPPGFNARAELEPLLGPSNVNAGWDWLHTTLGRLNRTPQGSQFLRENWGLVRSLLARHIPPEDLNAYTYRNPFDRAMHGATANPSFLQRATSLPRALASGIGAAAGNSNYGIDVIRQLDQATGQVPAGWR